MPVWGKPLRRGMRATGALRSPRSMVRFAARELLGAAGLASYIPIMNVLLMVAMPIISHIAREQARLEVERKLAEQERRRAEMYQRVYKDLIPELERIRAEQLQQVYRGVVPE